METKIEICDGNNTSELMEHVEKWELANKNCTIIDAKYTFKGLGVVCPHLLLIIYKTGR